MKRQCCSLLLVKCRAVRDAEWYSGRKTRSHSGEDQEPKALASNALTNTERGQIEKEFLAALSGMEQFCDWLLAQGGYAGWWQAIRRCDEETNAQCFHTTTDKSTFIKGEGIIQEIQCWRQLVERISFLKFHGEEEVRGYAAVRDEHNSGHARLLARRKPLFTALIEEREKILGRPWPFCWWTAKSWF